MAVVTGDRYLEKLVRFVDGNAGPLIDGTLVLKLNPTGLHYVQSRLEALGELEGLLAGAPVDYLRAYVSDLGDHRALEQLRRILRLLTSLKVVSVLAPPARDPTPVSLAAFGRLRDLELRGCDLSSSAAKGLLELRHTLERIVCHNSTDALRHVFASRLAEVKESPQWKRLSFVSCAGNGLLLMDESLQLLPAVETLDLSRNKLTKVDNLRHCLNLKHLDLGFNNLRSVSSFNQVSCNIVKLVLRNNALSTLHGIENLKSLEDLDVSYNIISNFSQLEFLVGLPYLGTLWLEGNPLCCARWYRPQAFSYINHPHKFKLDNKEISTREFWKRQIIIARRQKRPASFGFYSPAVYDSKSEGSNRRRKKMTRLALIGGEGESTTLYSDQDSTSIDNEVQSREDTVLSDEDAEIADLMNKVEQMKKDGSVLWLREFKEWMDHPDENVVDHTTFIGQESLPTKTGENHTNEILRCAPHSLKASREESSTNGVESDRPYLDKLTELEYLDGIGVMGTSGEFLPIRMDPRDECLKSYTHEIRSTLKSAHATVSPLTTIDSISESHSSAPPGSPPQYRKDILKRRQCLEEDFVQFSEDSYSVASSDSYTSSSEDDACAFGPMSHADQSLNDNFSNTNKYLEREPLLDMFKDEYYNQGHRSQENGQCSATDCFSNKTDIQNKVDPYQLCSDEDPEIHCGDAESDLLHEKRGKPQTKRSVTRVQDGSNMVGIIETAEGFNSDVRGEECQFCDVDGNKYTLPSMGCTQPKDDFIRNHFNSDVADLRNREICHQFMRCDCVLEQDSLGRERDVALVLSSLRKLYILLIGSADDKSGTALRLLACHRVEDIKDVLVGVGLQLVRVSIEKGLTYLFLTRSVEKSINLFCLLNVFGSSGTDSKCSVKSLEQVQLNLFEKQIFGGSKVCIFQYALVLFQNNNHEADSWVPRSLFVAGVNLLLCAEDLRKFGSLLVDSSMPSYFTLDSYCSIADISEMVVEAKDNNCVTLALAHAHHLSGKSGKASDFRTWKLKCLSKDCVFKFVTLVKAIHVGMNTSSLNIRCIS